jgi:hypothetical protein
MKHLEQLFRELGMPLVQAEGRLAPCVLGQQTALCGERPTIFGSIGVTLEKEKLSDDGRYRGRYFRVRGRLQYRDRLVSTFDVTCRGIGKVDQDKQTVDRDAAAECLKRVSGTIREDVQKSE